MCGSVVSLGGRRWAWGGAPGCRVYDCSLACAACWHAHVVQKGSLLLGEVCATCFPHLWACAAARTGYSELPACRKELLRWPSPSFLNADQEWIYVISQLVESAVIPRYGTQALVMELTVPDGGKVRQGAGGGTGGLWGLLRADCPCLGLPARL